ncbi:venom serine protease-like [Macrobrachium nipponense]|uniref:venom serine protease-like n=1 Tax=Macrobrachium nipponense TaxID=159736 RepID=UPI0030C7A281
MPMPGQDWCDLGRHNLVIQSFSMDILCQILGLLFLMVLQAESMSLGWDEESLTDGGHDVDWVGYGSNLGAHSVDQPWSEDNWRDTWYNDNEEVLLEPGETATFSFTFGKQEASKYVEYKISNVRTLSSYSSLMFTCDMRSLWNSSDCSSGKVTIGYGQKTLRLCNETHSLKDEQAGYSLRILAENILPSYHGNIHCRIYANSCGKRNTKRIITGTETLPHEYPWQVGLIFSKLNPDVFCGGSIIGPYHILTAAHCIDKPNSTYGSSFRPLAVVGLHDYRKPLAATKYLNIAKMTLHPAYDSKTYVNDIAILKTEQPIPFDVKNTVSPICLPEDPNNKYGNTEVSVCGWGRTIGSDGSSNSPVLLHTVMTTMTNVMCKKMVSSTFFIPDEKICALASGKSQGLSCRGDSGGPLMYQHGSHMDLIGIASSGPKGCLRELPKFFTRVASYLDWIRLQMKTP